LICEVISNPLQAGRNRRIPYTADPFEHQPLRGGPPTGAEQLDRPLQHQLLGPGSIPRGQLVGDLEQIDRDLGGELPARLHRRVQCGQQLLVGCALTAVVLCLQQVFGNQVRPGAPFAEHGRDPPVHAAQHRLRRRGIGHFSIQIVREIHGSVGGIGMRNP
jgi:hypothetical protein